MGLGTAQHPIDIVVVNAVEIDRIGLSSLFKSSSEYRFRACDLRDLNQALINTNAFGVVAIFDIENLRADPAATLHELVRYQPTLRVLALYCRENPGFFVKGLELRLLGGISKTDSFDMIQTKVKRAHRGEQLWTKEEIRRFGGLVPTSPSNCDFKLPLTQRESEVFLKLSEGLSNQKIASELNIGYETVKEYVHIILKKAGVLDRTQAATWAIRHRMQPSVP